MAQVVVLMAGLLLIAELQASDVAESSTHQGFLSKYEPSGSDASQSSMSDYDNFITPNFNRVKHGNGPDALSYHNNPAEHENREEMQSAQKLLANNSNPISFSAIGIGLLSLVTMLVVRLRRGLQPAAILASSGGHGPDMPMNTKSALGDNVFEMKSQDSKGKVNSGRVGWGQLSSQSARPTSCYASKEEILDDDGDSPAASTAGIGLAAPVASIARAAGTVAASVILALPTVSFAITRAPTVSTAGQCEAFPGSAACRAESAAAAATSTGKPKPKKATGKSAAGAVASPQPATGKPRPASPQLAKPQPATGKPQPAKPKAKKATAKPQPAKKTAKKATAKKGKIIKTNLKREKKERDAKAKTQKAEGKKKAAAKAKQDAADKKKALKKKAAENKKMAQDRKKAARKKA